MNKSPYLVMLFGATINTAMFYVMVQFNNASVISVGVMLLIAGAFIVDSGAKEALLKGQLTHKYDYYVVLSSLAAISLVLTFGLRMSFNGGSKAVMHLFLAAALGCIFTTMGLINPVVRVWFRRLFGRSPDVPNVR